MPAKPYSPPPGRSIESVPMTPGAVFHGPLVPYGEPPVVLCSTCVVLLPNGELFDGRVQVVPTPTVCKWGGPDFAAGWLARVDDSGPWQDGDGSGGGVWKYVHGGELDDKGPGYKSRVFESSGDAFDAARTLFGTLAYTAGQRGGRALTVSPSSGYATGRDGLGALPELDESEPPRAIGRERCALPRERFAQVDGDGNMHAPIPVEELEPCPNNPRAMPIPRTSLRSGPTNPRRIFPSGDLAFLLLVARPTGGGVWSLGLGVYSEERPTQCGALCVGTVAVFEGRDYGEAAANARGWVETAGDFCTGGLVLETRVGGIEAQALAALEGVNKASFEIPVEPGALRNFGKAISEAAAVWAYRFEKAELHAIDDALAARKGNGLGGSVRRKVRARLAELRNVDKPDATADGMPALANDCRALLAAADVFAVAVKTTTIGVGGEIEADFERAKRRLRDWFGGAPDLFCGGCGAALPAGYVADGLIRCDDCKVRAGAIESRVSFDDAPGQESPGGLSTTPNGAGLPVDDERVKGGFDDADIPF